MSSRIQLLDGPCLSPIQQYIPGGSCAASVIARLNDIIPTEIALPGNWSPILFYQDLNEFPVRTKLGLAEAIVKANRNNTNYLEFFKQTRGYSRKVCESQVWHIFDSGSIMLYFEELFLKLIQKEQLDDVDQILVKYLEVLSKLPVAKWNKILKNIGACCYQYFTKEPETYARLIFRNPDNISLEDMTDQELLDEIQANLSPRKYRGRISMEDSRQHLIEAVQAKREGK